MKIPHDYKSIDTSPKPTQFERNARLIAEGAGVLFLMASMLLAMFVLYSFA